MKHGSVIVKGGRVISTGVNKDRSHPKIVSSEHIKQHCSVHAEVDAIKRAKDVSGATIYVARVNRRGEQRDSRPCSRCYEAIRKSGIKKIVYTTSEG
jgi:deoxycytidylate deaminase